MHLQTEMAGLAHELSQQPNPHFLGNVLKVMEHIERQTQAELDWVRGLREEELARREEAPSDAAQGDEKGIAHD